MREGGGGGTKKKIREEEGVGGDCRQQENQTNPALPNPILIHEEEYERRTKGRGRRVVSLEPKKKEKKKILSENSYQQFLLKRVIRRTRQKWKPT